MEGESTHYFASTYHSDFIDLGKPLKSYNVIEAVTSTLEAFGHINEYPRLVLHEPGSDPFGIEEEIIALGGSLPDKKRTLVALSIPQENVAKVTDYLSDKCGLELIAERQSE